MSCIATISALGASLVLAAHGVDTTLVIGTEDSFPPYVLRDAAGQLSGFDVEVMGEICKRTRHDCDWRSAAFAELIPGVMAGEFDVVIGGMAITPARRKQVAFSTPYTYGGSYEWFIGFDGAPKPEQATIAVEQGTIHEDWLRAEQFDFTSYSSEAAVLEAVADGKAELAFGPYSAREDLNDRIAAQGLSHLYEVEIPDEGTGMAVCLGNTLLLAEINKAIDAMYEDGTLDRLNDRWF